MKTSTHLGPEFGPFLYASVGEDGNGMPLSVLSTIARRNLDPWHEAAELAALPVELAKKRLATLIAGLPGVAARLDVGKTADRLMALLPKRADSTAPQSTTPPDLRGLIKSSLITWMVAMGFILGVQAMEASRQPPEQVAQAPASTTSTVLVPKPPIVRTDNGYTAWLVHPSASRPWSTVNVARYHFNTLDGHETLDEKGCMLSVCVRPGVQRSGSPASS